jgi:hypothetical protein
MQLDVEVYMPQADSDDEDNEDEHDEREKDIDSKEEEKEQVEIKEPSSEVGIEKITLEEANLIEMITEMQQIVILPINI